MKEPFFISRNLDEESYKIVLPSFLKELKAELVKLKKEKQNNDIEAVRKISHKIKGTSKGFGAASVASIAQKTEHELKEGVTEHLEENIAKLEKQIKLAFVAAKEQFSITIT